MVTGSVPLSKIVGPHLFLPVSLLWKTLSPKSMSNAFCLLLYTKIAWDILKSGKFMPLIAAAESKGSELDLEAAAFSDTKMSCGCLSCPCGSLCFPPFTRQLIKSPHVHDTERGQLALLRSDPLPQRHGNRCLALGTRLWCVEDTRVKRCTCCGKPSEEGHSRQNQQVPTCLR